jgi:phospholipase C
VRIRARRAAFIAATAVAATAACVVAVAAAASPTGTSQAASDTVRPYEGTTTPIQHVVVIFDENVSFDHYFGTYPQASNKTGVPFTPAVGTKTPTNLLKGNLLTKNPNEYQPQRLSIAQALTCDQNHAYLPEQKAADGGKNDLYVQNTSTDTCSGGLYQQPGLAMDYYDGNTVTALWNYAQNYSLNDASYSSTYGPSTPGALNLIAGTTHGVSAVNSVTGAPDPTNTSFVKAQDANGIGTLPGDTDPAYDDCSDSNHTSTNDLAKMTGKNIGDLLNQDSVTWGWFQGGFKPTTPYAGSGTYAVCGASHANIGGASSVDYSPHHSPFEYYASTSNPHHLPPSSVYAVGHTDQANHNYDLSDFNDALSAGVMPQVSFLKAPEYQDGHAGYSDPVDEQHFLVNEINAIQKSQFWPDTAIVVAYDDSDGWYDQLSSPILNGSNDPTNDAAACTTAATTVGMAGGYADRCGPGTRQPLLVISPYSKVNTIDHTPTEQASITQFIEDNWKLGRLGDASFDQRAGTLDNMFNFKKANNEQVLLNLHGQVTSKKTICGTMNGWSYGCGK